jgi:Pilus formation protein N terminal region
MLLAAAAFVAVTLGQCVVAPPPSLTATDWQLIRETIASEELVPVGGSKVVTVPDAMLGLQSSNPESVGVKRLSEHQLLVVGNSPGRSEVRFGTSDGATRLRHFTAIASGVDDCSNPSFLRGLTPLSQHFARLRIVGEQLVYTGEIDVIEEYDRLRDRLRSSGQDTPFLVRPSARAIEARVARLNADLATAHLDGLCAAWVDGEVVLEPASRHPTQGSRKELSSQMQLAAGLLSAARDDLR